MNKILLAALLAGSTNLCFSQKKIKNTEFAPLHFGLTQGIGTNGVYDLKHINNISVNLLSGQSWGNNLLCISGISHFQLLKSQGIYLTGIASVSGGYPFLGRRELKDSTATFNAVQVSGLVNILNGGGDGAQVSGLLNITTESLDGLQLAGLYNNTTKGFSGAQMSLLVNRIGQFGIGVQSGLLLNTSKNFSGGQFFGLFNVVENDLDGIQIGGFNYIGNEASPVYRNFRFYYLQLGLVNKALQNGDGLQLGLINFGKNVGFSQVGIINFSQKVPQYPIGLLNISGDAQGFLRVSANRVFGYNIELGTGSKKLMNGVTYSFDSKKNMRALGYALGNQLKGGHKNNEIFFDYYLTLTQLKEEDQSFLEPNFIYGGKIQFGYNPFLRTKMPWMFFFVGISGNYYKNGGIRLAEGFLASAQNGKEQWVDLNFGIQL